MHETPSEIYIAMELMEGGQLEAVIKERRKQGKLGSVVSPLNRGWVLAVRSEHHYAAYSRGCRVLAF